MHTVIGDLRYGARLLLRSPGFTLVAVAALAMGIGANLTIFGFASALLLRPPAGVADPGRVVRVFTNRFSNTAYPDYEAYRDRNRTFVTLAAMRGEPVSVRTTGAPEQRFALAVSGNYFEALGVRPALGVPSSPPTTSLAPPACWCWVIASGACVTRRTRAPWGRLSR